MEAGEELNVAARGLATGYSSGSAMPGSASALLVAHGSVVGVLFLLPVFTVRLHISLLRSSFGNSISRF